MTFTYWMGRTLSRVFFRLFGGIRVRGAEHVPAAGAYLICANHCSLLDPPLVGVTFRIPIGYMAKKELFAIPVFGRLLRRLNVIPVDRRRLGKETVRGISGMLTAGLPVLVFPEGTRSRTGRLGNAKAGIGLLARETGVPLVPAFISNSRRWPWTWRRHNRLAVTFGRPIPREWVAEVSTRKTGYHEIAERVMQSIRSLQQGAGVGSTTAAPTVGMLDHRLYAPTGKSR